MKLSVVSSSSVALFLFPILVASHTVQTSTRICKDYSISLNITSPVLTPVYPKFEDSFDVAGFINSINARDADVSFNPFLNGLTHPVNAMYTISATVCSPTSSTAKGKTLLLATHGLGYDRK